MMMKRPFLRWALKIGALLVVLGTLGFVVAASGLVPIKASSGHWAITRAVLEFGKNRSLATHTIGMDLPPLDDPALVLRGAGHYEIGCRPCHGSPDLKKPRIAAHMTPSPPYLPPLVPQRDPEALFYVVKHGIKFTGMPAWPSQERDDEVRAVVAFLLKMPELDAASYRRLVDGEAQSSDSTGSIVPLRDLPEPPPHAVIASCARCHGVKGDGRGRGAFPKLAGQRPLYLEQALRAYAADQRHSGIMGPIAVGLRPDEWSQLAEYYAGVGGHDPSSEAVPAVFTDRASIDRGEQIATRGIPSAGVPSCMDCHGPKRAQRNPAYPNLAGQYATYVVSQLELFKEGKRGGSSYAHLMSYVATRLSTEQMRDVARYYASLPAESDQQAAR